MELISISTLFKLCFTIVSIGNVSLVSVQDVSKSDIIIDINKGFALRRLGVYSPNVVEQVVHTFLPLRSYCVASPNADVCIYDLENKNTNVLELGTMMESHDTVHTLYTYSKNDVSRLTGDDLNRMLTQHQPNQVMNDSASIFHFLNKQFVFQKSDKDLLKLEPRTNALRNDSNIPRVHSTLAVRVLQSISNNEIVFDYLPYEDLYSFLTAIFVTVDSSYTIYNVQKALNTFKQLVVGQSVFALRYCLFSNSQSVSSQPCLAISTLFLQNPIDDTSRSIVFRLIPVPFALDHERYVYSNLPKMIGINFVDNTLVLWNNDMDVHECIFSAIILCKKKPISILLSKVSCLVQLFDDQSLSTNMCSVTRSQDLAESVFAIANGIWYVYNVDEDIRCDIVSSSNERIETIKIKEPAILRLPCNRQAVCTDFKLPTVSCESTRVTFLPTTTFNVYQFSRFLLPISNYGQIIKSAFRKQSEKSILSLLPIRLSQQSNMKQMARDVITSTCSILVLLIVIALLYVFKFIKYKLQNKINDLESIVHDIALI